MYNINVHVHEQDNITDKETTCTEEVRLQELHMYM